MILTKEQLHDALVERHGADIQAKLDKACVGIAGLGGLGSNLAIFLARLGVGHLILVDFDVVDAQEIPYADASYDAITMAYGIRNMPDRPRALSEMYRVLKPGGSLVCLEFSTPPNAVWRALYNFYLKHLIPFWGGLITGDRDGFVYLSKSIKAFPNQQGLARMMEDAGFTDVTWKNYTGGIAAVHVAKKPD